MKMELIERYIYGVTKRLPETQREDIGNELRGLIEDMLDERVHDREATEEDVSNVLQELGHPRNLAQKYRGNKKYVIGPELYDLYMLVLKIGLISASIVLTAILIINIIVNPPHILDSFVDYVVSIFTTLPMVIGWTTLGFVIADYFSEGELTKLQLDKDWDPSNLPPIPDPNQQIKRRDPIIGIVCYVFIILVVAFSNEYFGIWMFDRGEFSGIVPFLNEKTYGSFLLLVLIVFGFGIVKEFLKLIHQKWTYSLVIFTGVVNLISIGAIMLLISRDNFWNPNFMNELVQQDFITKGSEGYQTVQIIWEQLTLWILVLLILGLIWDIVAGFMKVRKTVKK